MRRLNEFLAPNLRLGASRLLATNYGLSSSTFRRHSLLANFSLRALGPRGGAYWALFLERNQPSLNRMLRLGQRKHMEAIKKQSSWRALRLRQGLPVRGQRTHSNASTAKRRNASMFNHEIR